MRSEKTVEKRLEALNRTKAQVMLNPSACHPDEIITLISSIYSLSWVLGLDADEQLEQESNEMLERALQDIGEPTEDVVAELEEAGAEVHLLEMPEGLDEEFYISGSDEEQKRIPGDVLLDVERENAGLDTLSPPENTQE